MRCKVFYRSVGEAGKGSSSEDGSLSIVIVPFLAIHQDTPFSKLF